MLLAGLGLSSGCFRTPTAPNEGDNSPLSSQEVRSFYERGRDPRQLWITVYASDQGPQFSGDHRLHPNQTCILPILTKRDRLVPIVHIKGRSTELYAALIDTTSAESWTDFSTAVQLGITPLTDPAYTTSPTHILDHSSGFLCAGDTIRLDRLHVESPLFFVLARHGSLGLMMRNQRVADLHFVLGMRFLQSFRTIQFDFPQRQLILTSTRDYSPDPAHHLATVPYSLNDGVLFVEGKINDNPQPILLDTAGLFEVILPDPQESTLELLHLGDLTFRDLTVGIHQDHQLGLLKTPRVGMRLLHSFRMTLDTEKRVIHFERPGAS